MINFREKANFIWSVADLLRGDYKQAEYGKVILPLTVLRRLDSLLEPTKNTVLDQYAKFRDQSDELLDRVLNRATGYKFHNRKLYVRETDRRSGPSGGQPPRLSDRFFDQRTRHPGAVPV